MRLSLCMLFGYCMGGLLALALAYLQPKDCRSLTLMATPWDFHQPDIGIGPAFTALAQELKPSLQKLGYLPVDILQSLFATFQPLHVLKKFSKFAALDPDSLEARKFVLVEDWLNDGVPLPAKVADEALRGWYGVNMTAHLQWRLQGQVIDPGQISVPSYVIVPGKDKIVPPQSALPLARALPHATLHEPMLGHIGLLAARGAAQQVWQPFFHWLSQHN